MKVVVDITRADLIKLNSRVFHRLRSTYVLLGVFWILTLVSGLFGFGIPNSALELGALVLVALVFGILGLVVMMVFTLFCTMLFSRKENGVLEQHEYELTDAGVFVKSPRHEGLTKWQEFVKIEKYGSFLAFRMIGNVYYIFPKRSFSDDSAFDDFFVAATERFQSSPNQRLHQTGER